MKVVLLAAGLGKRLLPITESIPKPMIPIAGKPILEYIITELTNLGFDEICIITGHLEEQVKNYFGNGDKFNSKITYFTQSKYLGTANALTFAKDWVGDDQFLLYLPDTIIPNDLKHILPRMINDKFEISIISSPVTKSEIAHSGSVEEQNGLVTKLSEKTENPASTLSWAGIAFFKNNYIFKIIENLQPSQRGEFEIIDAMNLILLHNRKIGNFTCKKYVDAGTISGVLDLNEIILNQDNVFNGDKINNEIKIKNPIYLGKNYHMGKNVELGPFVSIGDDVCIGDNVKLEHTIVLDNSHIRSNEIISRSVIDSKNNVLS